MSPVGCEPKISAGERPGKGNTMRMLPIFKHVEWATVSTEYTIPTTWQTSVHCVRNMSKSDLLFISQCSASYNTTPYHNFFIDTNLIHNFYINYIKLSSFNGISVLLVLQCKSWDLVGRASYNSFTDTNLIHNFYINYIKLSSSNGISVLLVLQCKSWDLVGRAS
jgi:hypothetical protein